MLFFYKNNFYTWYKFCLTKLIRRNVFFDFFWRILFMYFRSCYLIGTVSLFSVLLNSCGSSSTKKVPVVPLQDIEASLVYDNHNSYTFPTDRSVTSLNALVNTNAKHYNCSAVNIPDFFKLDKNNCNISIDESKIYQTESDVINSYTINVIDADTNNIIGHDDISVKIIKKTSQPTDKKTILSYSGVKNNQFEFTDGTASTYRANDANQGEASVGPFTTCSGIPNDSPVQFAKTGNACDIVYTGSDLKLTSDKSFGPYKIIGGLTLKDKSISSEPFSITVVIHSKKTPPPDKPSLAYDNIHVTVGQVPSTSFAAKVNEKDTFATCVGDASTPSFVTVNSDCSLLVAQNITNNDVKDYNFTITGKTKDNQSASANVELNVSAKVDPIIATINYASMTSTYDAKGTVMTRTPTITDKTVAYSCSKALVVPSFPSYLSIDSSCVVTLDPTKLDKNLTTENNTSYSVTADDQTTKGTIMVDIKPLAALTAMTFNGNNTIDFSTFDVKSKEEIFQPTFNNKSDISDINNLSCSVLGNSSLIDNMNQDSLKNCILDFTPNSIINDSGISKNETLNISFMDKYGRKVQTNVNLTNIK